MLEMGMYAAIAPLALLLLSTVWRYPAVLEEVVKWTLIRSKTIDDRHQWERGLVVGIVFGLSEAMLFSVNAWSGGQWGALGMRLLVTVPMHAVTAIVSAGSMKYRMGWIGLILAMIIHAGFNYWVR